MSDVKLEIFMAIKVHVVLFRVVALCIDVVGY
jgi:hypothetical protein